MGNWQRVAVFIKIVIFLPQICTLNVLPATATAAEALDTCKCGGQQCHSGNLVTWSTECAAFCATLQFSIKMECNEIYISPVKMHRREIKISNKIFEFSPEAATQSAMGQRTNKPANQRTGGPANQTCKLSASNTPMCREWCAQTNHLYSIYFCIFRSIKENGHNATSGRVFSPSQYKFK